MKPTARTLAYSVLDVFAEQPLAGNPLAVFHDARGLSTAQMQSIAREMNLSETTFVLPAEDPADDLRDGVRVRIFTTQEELPFAGHPTLGTATWLHLHHPALAGCEQLRLRLDAGLIPVRFDADPARLDANAEAAAAELGVGVSARMRQNDPVFGAEFDPAEVAAVLGLDAADLLAGHRPQSVSTGNAFCIVALRSLEALGRLAILQREATVWLRERSMRWFYCIAPTGATAPGQPQWRARMQFYGGEDPATGSAAGPCLAWLLRRGLAESGAVVRIEQGIEMLRPSLISGTGQLKGSDVGEIWIGGRTVPVAQGRLFLPAPEQFPTGPEPQSSIVTGR